MPRSSVKRLWSRAGAFIATRLDRRAELGLALTIALTGIALLLWGFVALADAFPERGVLARLDVATATWLQMHGSESGERVFLAVSWIGGPALGAVVAVVAVALAVRRAWLRLTLWISAVVGAVLLDLVLKQAFHRSRPIFAAEFIHDKSWSFPSGHALTSLVSYTVLAYLLLEHERTRAARRATIAGAAILIGAIGFSRLYLGVHYVSDVMAGYLAGGAWAIACITTYRIVCRQRVIGPTRDVTRPALADERLER